MLLALFQIIEGTFYLYGDLPLYALFPFLGVGTLLAVMLMTVPCHFTQFIVQIYFAMTMWGTVILTFAMMVIRKIEMLSYSVPVTFVLGVVIIALLYFSSAEEYYDGTAER